MTDLPPFAALHDVMACSQGTSAVLTPGGVDPRDGERYVSYDCIKGGFGAHPNKDGINAVSSGISNPMNRPIDRLLLDAGLEIAGLETMYLPGPRPLNFNYWGTARVG